MPDNLNNLDRLIDEVAREITGRPVDDGFARRVSVRIQDADAAGARVPRSWSRTRLLVPAAAVALLAVMIVRHVPSPKVRPTPDTAPQSATADVRPTTSVDATAVRKPDATTEPVTANVRLKPDATTRGAITTASNATQALARDSDLQPLTTAPIEMTSIDVSPLIVAMPIEISAIAIDRIEIAAMP